MSEKFLPDAGGLFDQAAIMIDAFACMNSTENSLKEK